MDTLGIWYEPIETGPEKTTGSGKLNEVKTDIHINLWKLQTNQIRSSRSNLKLSRYDRKFDHFLDLGLMISDISEINRICIFLPFSIQINEIIDLGNAFHQDANLVSAIFNADLRATSSGTKILEVENLESHYKFNIYSLDTAQQIKIEEYKDIGVVIYINLAQIVHKRTEAHYFRIRIKSENVRNFSRIYKPRNSFFESAFQNTEVIDFRINERRNLDKSILERIDSCVLPKINKINFFLLRNEKDDYVLSHKPSDNCRGLEKGLWRIYLGDNYMQDDILAYHWKEKDTDSFRLLIKMKFEKNNVETIVKYILVIAGLSILFNVSASGIYDGIKCMYVSYKNCDLVSRISATSTVKDESKK